MCTRLSQRVIWDILFLWHCSCRTYVCCFPLALANTIRGFFCHSFKFLWKTVTSKPPILITFRIVACTFSDNLSQNNCLLLCLIQDIAVSWHVFGPCYSLVFFFHFLWVLLPRFQVAMYSSLDTYMHDCMCNRSWGIGQQGSSFGSIQFPLIVSYEFWIYPIFSQNCKLFLILVGKCISTLTKLFCHKWANFDGLYFI